MAAGEVAFLRGDGKVAREMVARASALDGAGRTIGRGPIQAKKATQGWPLPIGTPVTTWYLLSVRR